MISALLSAACFSLKDKYDPVNNKEDYLIEDILQRAFIDGILEEQPSKLDFNYLELSKKWIDVPNPVVKKKPKKQ